MGDLENYLKEIKKWETVDVNDYLNEIKKIAIVLEPSAEEKLKGLLEVLKKNTTLLTFERNMNMYSTESAVMRRL